MQLYIELDRNVLTQHFSIGKCTFIKIETFHGNSTGFCKKPAWFPASPPAHTAVELGTPRVSRLLRSTDSWLSVLFDSLGSPGSKLKKFHVSSPETEFFFSVSASTKNFEFLTFCHNSGSKVFFFFFAKVHIIFVSGKDSILASSNYCVNCLI